jgi:hypothetical protein
MSNEIILPYDVIGYINSFLPRPIHNTAKIMKKMIDHYSRFMKFGFVFLFIIFHQTEITVKNGIESLIIVFVMPIIQMVFIKVNIINIPGKYIFKNTFMNIK